MFNPCWLKIIWKYYTIPNMKIYEHIGMIIQLSTHFDSFTLAVKKSGDSPPLTAAGCGIQGTVPQSAGSAWGPRAGPRAFERSNWFMMWTWRNWVSSRCSNQLYNIIGYLYLPVIKGGKLENPREISLEITIKCCFWLGKSSNITN